MMWGYVQAQLPRITGTSCIWPGVLGKQRARSSKDTWAAAITDAKYCNFPRKQTVLEVLRPVFLFRQYATLTSKNREDEYFRLVEPVPVVSQLTS